MLVSVDVDELLMLLSLLIPVELDEPVPVVALPVVPLPVVPVPVVLLPVVLPVALRPVEPLPMVPLRSLPVPIGLLAVGDEPVVPVPAAVPVERVVPLGLLIDPLDVPVELVEPAFGPEFCVLLLGEPEAPPWPPELDWARAPPHAIAAAAESARILKVCLMGYS